MKLEGLAIRLSSPQMEAVLAGISNSTITSLKYLHLHSVEIQSIAPDIVAEAAMNLESFKAELSRTQVEAVLTRLADGQDSRLKNLTFTAFNLSSLDPELVARALIKLETLEPNLVDSLSAGHLIALISRICHSPESKLSALFLFNKDLSLVPPQDLVGAIQKLERAEFRNLTMSGEQLTAILTKVKERRLGRIKNLRIQFVSGMRSVSTSVLQEAQLNPKLKWIRLSELFGLYINL